MMHITNFIAAKIINFNYFSKMTTLLTTAFYSTLCNFLRGGLNSIKMDAQLPNSGSEQYAACITVRECYYRHLTSLAISGAIESPKYPCESPRPACKTIPSSIVPNPSQKSRAKHGGKKTSILSRFKTQYSVCAKCTSHIHIL